MPTWLTVREMEVETSRRSTSHPLGWLLGKKPEPEQSKVRKHQQKNQKRGPCSPAGEVVWTEERSYFVGERCKNGTAVENSMRVLQWFKCRHTLWSRGHTGYVPGRTESWGPLGYACIPTSMGIFPGPTRYSIPSIQRGWVTRWPVEPVC